MKKRFTVCGYEEDRYTAGYVVIDNSIACWGEEAFVGKFVGQTEHNRERAERMAARLNADALSEFKAADMQSLISKLESAEAGSRELSDEVLLACGWTTGAHKTLGMGWFPPGSDVADGNRPSPVESVDDALALVPSEHAVLLEVPAAGQPSAGIRDTVGALWPDNYKAATPALALCVAILHARASMMEDEDE